MKDFYNKKLKNPHYQSIIILVILITILYQFWPWRDIHWAPWLANIATFEFINSIIGVLYLFPIIYSFIFFRWFGSIIVMGLSLCGMTVVISKLLPGYSFIINNVAILFLPLSFIAIFLFSFESNKKERQFYIQQEKDRRAYISSLIETQEQSRQQLARELHDDTIQTLVAIKKRTDSLISSIGQYPDIVWIKDTILQTIDELRRITLSLRPSILDELGLIPAIRFIVDRFKIDWDINFDLEIIGQEQQFTSYIDVMVFRILQEACNNIRRHSKATKATIILNFKTEGLLVTVADNGRGFNVPETMENLVKSEKFGLIGIKERVKLVNGTFDIISTPGNGTSLSIQIPY